MTYLWGGFLSLKESFSTRFETFFHHFARFRKKACIFALTI